MNPSFDPKQALEWLYQKREEVDQVIHFMERQVQPLHFSPQSLVNPVKIEIVPLQPPPQKEAPSIRIKQGQFEGMKIWEAARAFLVMTKTAQSTTQIATCLIRGGITSRAQRLETNLYTVLKNKSDIFQKVGPGLWGLTKELG
jgi:hypothetical protein